MFIFNNIVGKDHCHITCDKEKIQVWIYIVKSSYVNRICSAIYPGQAREIWVLITCAQMPLKDIHADISSKARGLKFVYAISEGFGELYILARAFPAH